MKKMFLLILSFSFIGLSFGQKLKQKKVSNFFCTEEYKVDKETGLREGNYTKIDEISGNVILTGQYEHGKKIGVWRYYALDNELLSSFDYNRMNLVFMINAMDPQVEFPVYKDGEYILSHVDSPAFFMGTEQDLNATILDIQKVPKSFSNAKKEILAAASFVIQADGSIADVKLEMGDDPDINADFLKLLDKMPDLWIPAYQNGKAVATKHFYFLVLNDDNGAGSGVTVDRKPYVKILPIRIKMSYNVGPDYFYLQTADPNRPGMKKKARVNGSPVDYRF